MPAVLFGSISAVADTSELQRQAFNDAFHAHGLDWRWEQDEYRDLIQSSGGKDRIAEYGRAQGVDVDAEAIHKTKSERFQALLAEAGLSARPGVAETIKAAKDEGWEVGFITTTTPENVAALLDGVDGVQASDFDLVTDVNAVDAPKPDPAIYALALETLKESPDTAVAIEDNLGGVDAGKAAGLTVLAFPNENTQAHDFAKADRTVDALSFDDVRTAVAA
jgi:HAD superfamily hydrolase (TIGR01509 family)